MDMRQDDLILEGVNASEVASLKALDKGDVSAGRPDIAPLRAKGWVEMFGDDAIITLTGRALLERQAARLR
jgi:hypothetical protein